MLNKLRTIKGRLWMLTGFTMLTLATISVIESYISKKTNAYIHTLSEQVVPTTRHMTLTDMMHDGIRATVYQAFFEQQLGNRKALEEIGAELEVMSANIKKYPSDIKDLNLTEEINSLIEEALPLIDRYTQSANEVIVLLKKGNRSAASTYLDQFNKDFENLEEKLEVLGEKAEERGLAISEEAVMTEKRSKLIHYGVVIGAFILAFASSVWVIRDLVRRVKAITNELNAQAQSLNKSSDSISNASQQLASAATEQSTAIEETVTSMEEIGSMIAQTAQNATSTMNETQSGISEVHKGKEVVARMVTSMDDISRSNDQLQTIIRVMEDIKTKTRVINDIAFETKLLSFNASIEAARAGSHGRGFAVVAEEVGKLANVSSKAADEVRNLLDTSSSQVASIVEETKRRVQTGQNNSKECEHAFGIMEQSLDTINKSVQLIATATKEQESGVSQSNIAMGEMEKATQSNTRSADALSSQSGTLMLVSSTIAKTVQDMMAMVGDSDSLVSHESPQKPTRGKTTESKGNGGGSAGKDSNNVTPITAQSSNENKNLISRDDDRWNTAS